MLKPSQTRGTVQLESARIRTFRRSLLRWYQAHKREFLWREDYPDAYVVLVSEFMLQQTQTSRVQTLAPLFLQRFPTIQTLAAATNAEMIVAWRGLGYNSRALRLRDCARAVVLEHGGQIPASEELLLKLPGIGPYTAAALSVFAFHQTRVVIDVNIERVISRVFADELELSGRPPTDRRKIAELLQQVHDAKHISAFYQGLMDVGAQICKARSTQCTECPLEQLCSSAHRVVFHEKTKRAEPSHRSEPNRIWRGRCVELLRHSPKHQSSVQSLLSKLIDQPDANDAEWFATLLKSLERDEIVLRAKSSVRLRD